MSSPALLDRLRALESVARRLEPTPTERRAVREEVLRYTENFLDRIGELPAFVAEAGSGEALLNSPPGGEDPVPVGEILSLLEREVDRPGLNPASGGHLAYIPGGGIYYSSLGDYLADVTNRFAGVFFVGPGAVRLEHQLLRWMGQVVGYPSTSEGNLTSGGSIANLMGIVAARDACGITVEEITRSVIYLTGQVHHSVDKAIRIAGLRQAVVRTVPVDARSRMDAAALEDQVRRDARGGLRPWLVIASAGTTDTGAVDPLEEIAAVARRHGLWNHVDGAYGAFFALTESGKTILRGMESSDSLVMDPHKGLFLPYGTGAVLIRDGQKLYDSFWYQAAYLQDALSASVGHSPADLSPELTKHFRGLRLWLPLKLLGLAPFRAALEEKLLLARYFHEKIGAMDGFEAGPVPDLSVVTYRYVPRRGDANSFNELLVKAVQQDGRVFLSSTMLNGLFTLRLAVLCFRTHRDTVDLTLDILRDAARKLERSL